MVLFSNLVCVYAICKNESKNVERWLDSVKDADLIYITDTGSTDDTVELLSKYRINNSNINIVIDKCIIEPFNFAHARNICLREAKKYAKNYIKTEHKNFNWVYVAMDLDEFLDPGAIDIIRINWNPKYDTLFTRARVASTGEVFDVRHKIHGENVEWHRSIHEILDFNGKKEAMWNSPDFGIYYTHDQDFSKERNYYEMLLEAFDTFNDRSIKTLTYLSQESLNRNKMEDALKYIQLAYEAIFNNVNDPYYFDKGYIICLRYYYALYYNSKKDYKNAYEYISKIIEMFANKEFPHIRNIYKLAAEICWELYKESGISAYYNIKALFYYNFILNIDIEPIKETKAFWLENYDLYSKKEEALIYNSISIIYYDMGLYKESLMYLDLAIKTDNSNSDLFISNRKIIEGAVED